jgi:hypothetical protein
VSFDETKGLYHCHGEACDFSGGAGKLVGELGLAVRLSSLERRELRWQREMADRAAWTLYHHVKARRLELLDELDTLHRLESLAHEAGTDHPAAWDALAHCYGTRSGVLAELEVLENASAADLLRFLSAGQEEQEQVLQRVIIGGGLWDSDGRFVELHL